MDGLFKDFKKLIRPKSATIDDVVFVLHYRVTFLILLACSIFNTARSYFGEAIRCISKDDVGEGNKVLNAYCWVHTTFSVDSAYKKDLDLEVPYFGVDKFTGTGNETRTFHAYYQWVCFVLFFQALAFYVPRMIWKAYEGGVTTKMTKAVKDKTEEEDRYEIHRQIVHQLIETEPLHNGRFWIYITTEVLNLVNVIVQMFIMDAFLGFKFSNLGLEVLNFKDLGEPIDPGTIRYSPLLEVFPRLTKCTFRRYGSSGDLQKHDAMCLLPINIVNEKIYIFLWFWFYVLAIITICALLYRAATVVVPRVRQLATYSIRRMSNPEARKAFESVISHCSQGTWFQLHLLYKNMNSKNFKEFIIEFNKEFKNQE